MPCMSTLHLDPLRVTGMLCAFMCSRLSSQQKGHGGLFKHAFGCSCCFDLLPGRCFCWASRRHTQNETALLWSTKGTWEGQEKDKYVVRQVSPFSTAGALKPSTPLGRWITSFHIQMRTDGDNQLLVWADRSCGGIQGYWPRPVAVGIAGDPAVGLLAASGPSSHLITSGLDGHVWQSCFRAESSCFTLKG